MNGVGIDLQHAVTLAALREGDGLLARTRLISDGQRCLIPNAVAEGRWGSAAYRGGSVKAERQAFLRHLAQRIHQYLGRVEPIPQNGYQVVVAAHDDATAASDVESAGLDRAAIIASTDALLCRWLAENPDTDVKLVATVAIGDTSAAISAHQLSNTPRRVSRSPVSGRIDNVGFLDWTERLLGEVRARLRDVAVADEELTLRDGALEFAAKLRGATNDVAVPWTGPFRGQCYSIPTLSRRDCLVWPTAVTFAAEAPALVRRSVNALAAGSQPELVVLGGLGAVWPVAHDILRQHWPVWTSALPEEDIAVGAAWWPSLSKHFGVAAALNHVDAAIESTLEYEKLRDTPTAAFDATDPGDIPPWKR
jgi:hypothetical protein